MIFYILVFGFGSHSKMPKFYFYPLCNLVSNGIIKIKRNLIDNINESNCPKEKLKMQKQLMDEMSFKKIISNQGLIIQDLDKSYNSMCSFMQLSNKYLPEAMTNFNIGQQHIAKIRQNLDAIHKIMSKIQKKINKEKQQEKIELQAQKHKEQQQSKSNEIVTVSQAVNQMVNEETKENFQVSSPTLLEMQTQQKINQNKIENELEKDQVEKLFAYYKLDDQEDNSSANTQIQNMSPTTKKFEQAFTLSPAITKAVQPFTIIKSPHKPKEQQSSTVIDEPLI